jgi:hypothetical protein
MVVFFLITKAAGADINPSHSRNANVKKKWCYTSKPPFAFKNVHREKLCFYSLPESTAM